MIRLVLILICILTSLLPIYGQGAKGNDCSGFEFTNKLGVDATSAIDSFKYEVNNAAADYFLNSLRGIVIQLGDDTYLSIPVCSFIGATLQSGEHTVVLATGEMIKGRLIGSFTSGGKLYNLDSITKIRAINPVDQAKQNRPAKTWTLTFDYPSIPALIVTEPQFGSEYSQTFKKANGMFYTWEMGSSYRASESFSALDEKV